MDYKLQNVICQNCKKDFTIEPEDFLFYEKIKVPPPTICPECRQQRRYAWRNERNLYRRNCDLCNKSIVTIYSPNKELKVFCPKCWWGDNWDPSLYGKNYDFSRSFFEQYKELQKEVPRLSLLSKNCVNSDYTNHSTSNNNVYLSFSCFDVKDTMYSSYIMQSSNCLDCSYLYEDGDKCYECVNSKKIYKCQNSIFLKDCMDCFYCYDCRNCSDCFLSSNLRNKKFVFKNKQLTKSEYLHELKKIKMGSFSTREILRNEFIDLIENKSIHRYITGEANINSTGNNISFCKQAINCFDVTSIENSKNCFGSDQIKDSMDVYHVGFNTELAYECHGCAGLNNGYFCHLSYNDQNIEYCDTCHNSSNLFGCISVKKGEYMILNKKYSKEEYFKLKEKIIEQMKENNEYGEFFPPNIAPVCYNETQGHYYMPLSKEEVRSRGWLWEDMVPGVFGQETFLPEDLPDEIKNTSNSILDEVLKCVNCSKNYKIVADELRFYQKENIPIPRNCPDCRYKKRFALRLPRKLWHRKCMKEGCINEFETSYAPDRPEIVYCEQCYQQEIY